MGEINIAELLKDCPKGTKLYSPLCGECYFDSLNMGTIICKRRNEQDIAFTSEGYYMLPIYNDCECLLFPSKDQRDWSKFQIPYKFDISTLKPFDEVLVRDNNQQQWTCDLFSHYKANDVYKFISIGHYTNQCIPYEGNEHLCGTTNDCDEYFKNWK